MHNESLAQNPTSVFKAMLLILCALSVLMLIAGCSNKHAFTGTWKITEAHSVEDAAYIGEVWTASGAVKVTENKITIDAVVDGTVFRETGTFVMYTEKNRPMYETSDESYIVIGESNGVYIVSYTGSDTLKWAINLVVERN